MFVTTGLLAGCLVWGLDPVRALSGTQLEPGRGLVLVAASALVYALPMLAFCAIAPAPVDGDAQLGRLGRRDAAALGLPAAAPPLGGLLLDPIDRAPVVRATWVSVVVAAPATAVGVAVFLRRDVTGG